MPCVFRPTRRAGPPVVLHWALQHMALALHAPCMSMTTPVPMPGWRWACRWFSGLAADTAGLSAVSSLAAVPGCGQALGFYAACKLGLLTLAGLALSWAPN